jgi:hypothetical protein
MPLRRRVLDWRWLADPAATEHDRQAARSVVVRVGGR